MRTHSVELENLRRNEILDACAKLYEEKGFRDITIKDISLETSITRPAIYKYFETKEEIFLGLLTREATGWLDSLKDAASRSEAMSKNEFTAILADSLAERTTMLKILSMNIYEIEDNSRLERLTEYKTGFREINQVLEWALGKVEPSVSKRKINKVTRLFMPFMNGIYAYAFPTEKQWKAMENAGLDYKAPTIREFIYEFLCELL